MARGSWSYLSYWSLLSPLCVRYLPRCSTDSVLLRKRRSPAFYERMDTGIEDMLLCCMTETWARKRKAPSLALNHVLVVSNTRTNTGVCRQRGSFAARYRGGKEEERTETEKTIAAGQDLCFMMAMKTLDSLAGREKGVCPLSEVVGSW